MKQQNQTETPSNPPAFPTPHSSMEFYNERLDGMTLRDYFAAKAMQTLISHEDFRCGCLNASIKRVYEVADAMLKAREGGEG